MERISEVYVNAVKDKDFIHAYFNVSRLVDALKEYRRLRRQPELCLTDLLMPE